MALILIGAIAGGTVGWIVQGFYEEKFRNDIKCSKCAYAHKESGLNYVWLQPYYGKLLKVEYKEPAETGSWRDYTDKIWDIHCNVINHRDNLIDSHMKAFVNPETRFAKLRFIFNKNGIIYVREPDRHFYELEKKYFEDNGICN